MAEIFLVIDFRSVRVPFAEEVDDVLDDLSENLLLALELIFELVLETLVLAGEELILLVEADADLF